MDLFVLDIINVVSNFSDGLKEQFVASTITRKATNIYHAMDLFEKDLKDNLKWDVSDTFILTGNVGYLFKGNEKLYMGFNGDIYTQDLRDYFDEQGVIHTEIKSMVEMAGRVRKKPIELKVVK